LIVLDAHKLSSLGPEKVVSTSSRGEHAAESSHPNPTTTAGIRMESCKMALTSDIEKGSRKKVNASHPEHMMYIVAKTVLVDRLLR
jgi:hypothetical protein